VDIADATMSTRADALADALVAVMVPVAQRAEQVPTTALTPEMVELVVDLGELARYLVEHTRRVMSGEPAHDWAEVADALAAAMKTCRRLVVLDATQQPPRPGRGRTMTDTGDR
jgi:hypothetical protein